MLILSHREELVEQPRKYFDCSYGIERAQQHSHGEEVVSASIQTLVRRLDQFDPEDFRLIICDEAHHAAASTYRKIFDHFRPEKLIGFTATPNRGDKVRLDTVFSKIIFQRDLRWGVQNGYLCNIHCRRVDIGFDLSAVHTRRGDYAPGELDEAMDGTADAIAEAYRSMAVGATLIFAVSVHQAEEIAKRIKGAVVVTGETKDRASIIQAFTAGEIPCIVNCMVFTEGTDIPRVETVIIARPTQSETLYAQMVGRGLRLYPGKQQLELIDCVGITGKTSLCTAPSLLGIDNIGLRAHAVVTDSEVIAAAEQKELRGWSFGFVKQKDHWKTDEEGTRRRFVDELELREVSILDKTPAYIATSIETRDDDEILVEFRADQPLEDGVDYIRQTESTTETKTTILL